MKKKKKKKKKKEEELEKGRKKKRERMAVSDAVSHRLQCQQSSSPVYGDKISLRINLSPLGFSFGIQKPILRH
jgi:hypothetical protein